MLMTIGISTKDNQSKGTMVSSLLKLVDSKELHPSQYDSTKNKMLLAESLGQRLLVFFTALSLFYVEQPHDKVSALTKYPTIRCKSHLER